MKHYIIGIGSSDLLAYTYIQRAVLMLAKNPHIKLVSTSQTLITPPAHGQTLFRFVNAAACISSSLHPQVLLWQLRQIEFKLGRMRIHTFGPRTLDLDILWCIQGSYHSAQLTIPHPRFLERPFAYIPAIEAIKKAKWPMPMAFKTLAHTPSSR